MAWPVAISTDGKVSCGAVIWRFQRRLELTVILKATFTIVPDGTAILAGPGEITREDRTFDRHPSRSVEAASDLAPYLARCDVTFTGHACAPGQRPAPASSVRLGISRDARLLLDKTLHVFGEETAAGAARAPFTRMPLVYERAFGGPGEPNPLGVETPNVVDALDARKPGGFGPISPFWPTRKRLLGKLERRVLDAPIVELPDPAPWDYFQAAPPDQQIEYLHGGEWLVLDGIHPQSPRVQTRLATARGAARISIARRGAAPEESRVELVCDSLAIDGDRQTLSVVWRGHFPIAGDEAALPTLRVLAGLEAPGAAVDWARLAAEAHEPVHAAPAARAERVEAVGEGTLAVDLEQVAHAVITPFEAAGPTAAAAPVSSAATPWAQAPLRPAPAVGKSKATVAISIAAPTEGAGEATIALRPSQQTDAERRPATPFAAGSEPAAEPSSSPAGRIVGAPWSGVSAPSAPTPQVGEGTMMLRDASSPPAVVAPPAMMTPIAPPPAMMPIAPPPAMTAPLAPNATPPAMTAPASPRRPEAPPPQPDVAAARAVDVKKIKAPPRDPDALASRLRTAGASAEDVAAMLQALRPPPPPPDDD